MKKLYISPKTEVVVLNVSGHYMEETLPIGQSRVTIEQLGKDNSVVVEEETVLPSQPNIWADDDEE